MKRNLFGLLQKCYALHELQSRFHYLGTYLRRTSCFDDIKFGYSRRTFTDNPTKDFANSDWPSRALSFVEWCQAIR